MEFRLAARSAQKSSSTSGPGNAPFSFSGASGSPLSTALICFVHVTTADSRMCTRSLSVGPLPSSAPSGSGSSVLPLVWPIVMCTLATNRCRFSVTSRATTSGQPRWLLLLVSSGTKTPVATACSVSSGTAPISPWLTTDLMLSASTLTDWFLMKYRLLPRNFGGGLTTACRSLPS